MAGSTKTSQLQIRVSPSEKTAIQRAARRAGLDMSAYVLSKVLPDRAQQFARLVGRLTRDSDPRFVLAEINSRLSRLSASELSQAVASPIPSRLSAFLANQVAAMVEYARARSGADPPAWTESIAPLDQPVFGTELESLRLYLLAHSPPPFRRRNIFVDTSVGGQV